MLGVSRVEKLFDAAIARLARGDGQGSMGSLGVQGAELLRDAGVGKKALYNESFQKAGDGDAVAGFVQSLMALLLDEQTRLRSEGITNYSLQTQSIADGAGRETIGAALLNQLAQYGDASDADALARARERVYYLALALCDAATSRSDRPISEDRRPLPDFRFRRHLLKIHESQRPALIDIYKEFLALADREPVHDMRRVERVMASFLEGVLVLRRISGSHRAVTPRAADPVGDDLALKDDELVDAVLRIFMVMTRPVGGEAPDPEAVLFRRNNRARSRAAPQATLHLDSEDLHRSLSELIDDLDAEDELSHCSLHTSDGDRAGRAKSLSEAVGRFAARGGRLRAIEKISSINELEATLSKLERQIAEGQDVRYRALVIDSPPAHAPLVVGNRVTFLTREEDGKIVDAVAFSDADGRRWCRSHFEALWDDQRAYELATPKGLNHHGISGARMQLEMLERQRESAVSLSSEPG